MIDFCRAQAGEPYVFAASGPDKWDCSGLTKRAAALVGLDWYHGASTQYYRGTDTAQDNKRYGYWGAYGTLDTMPLGKVCFLYNKDKKDPSKMAHTGIYDPTTGNVIQAGGQYRGVSDKPLNRNRWSHWAVLKDKYMEVDGVNEIPVGTPVEDDPLYPVLVEGRKDGKPTGAVHDLQRLLNAYDKRFALEVDGIFGKYTKAAVEEVQAIAKLPVTGIVTKTEWEYLRNAPTPPAVETVQIPLSLLKAAVDACAALAAYMPK